ncbi:hypothetical protein [Desertibacillus haloalkaliphilus]|uniref:hypothetical protein n=1 Tax=Desertibacillus haloalkaliphilus TaxID=1328930 RepID=UPI001C2751AB|nr:hypothetical protein [Desertibacillus haloalkaliphilus]MBU8907299.1 hypothetical protein [Desertibacillus haloalkaliphilus]
MMVKKLVVFMFLGVLLLALPDMMFAAGAEGAATEGDSEGTNAILDGFLLILSGVTIVLMIFLSVTDNG